MISRLSYQATLMYLGTGQLLLWKPTARYFSTVVLWYYGHSMAPDYPLLGAIANQILQLQAFYHHWVKFMAAVQQATSSSSTSSSNSSSRSAFTPGDWSFPMLLLNAHVWKIFGSDDCCQLRVLDSFLSSSNFVTISNRRYLLWYHQPKNQLRKQAILWRSPHPPSAPTDSVTNVHYA